MSHIIIAVADERRNVKPIHPPVTSSGAFSCVQVVFPRYSSLYKSLRRDLQLTCLFLTIAIYSCSLTVITWPTSRSAIGCRPVTSQSGDAERLPWTGRSFDDVTGRRSSSDGGRQPASGDAVTSAEIQDCGDTSSGDVNSTLTVTWFSLIVVIYLVYVVECWFSPYRCRFSDARRRVVDTRAAYDLVTSLRNSLPVVRWTAVSYHYIRSTVSSVGATTPLHRHQSFKQRVVTRRDSTLYHYALQDLLDRSASLVDLEAFPVTWLRISCQFSFGSAAARRDFARQRDAFYRANATRDQHVDFRQTLSLVAASGGGHIAWSRDMAVYNPDVRPWYTSVTAYWLASLLTLSWPLRLVIHWRTATVDYTVHKIFDSHVTDSDMTSPPRDDMSVTSLENSNISSGNTGSSNSIDVSDTRSMMDTDCVLAPSYSQAILMDTRTFGGHKPDRHYPPRQAGHLSCSRLRRAKSCLLVRRSASTNDVKPSTSLTTHLYKSAAAARQDHALLMTSRPPSYNTAMCFAGHVITP